MAKLAYYACGLQRGWVEIRRSLSPPTLMESKAEVKSRVQQRYYDLWGSQKWRSVPSKRTLKVIAFTGGQVIDILRGSRLKRVISGVKVGGVIPIPEEKVRFLK